MEPFRVSSVGIYEVQASVHMDDRSESVTVRMVGTEDEVRNAGREALESLAADLGGIVVDP